MPIWKPSDWTFPTQLAPSIIDTPLPDDEMAPRKEAIRNISAGCDSAAVMDPLDLLPRNMRNAPKRHRTKEEWQRLDPRNWPRNRVG